MPEAKIPQPKRDVLQTLQRKMRHEALWNDKNVRDSWKAYRKIVGPKGVHMSKEDWLDFNYKKAGKGTTRPEARHEEIY